MIEKKKKINKCERFHRNYIMKNDDEILFEDTPIENTFGKEEADKLKVARKENCAA